MDVVNRLRDLKIIHSETIAICYDTCIPVKGLNLDYVIDYFLFKKAKGVFLYSYDNLRAYLFSRGFTPDSPKSLRRRSVR